MFDWKLVLILPLVIVTGSAAIGFAFVLPSDGFSYPHEPLKGKIPSPLLSPISWAIIPSISGPTQSQAPWVSGIPLEPVSSPTASPVSSPPSPGYMPSTSGPTQSQAPWVSRIPLEPVPSPMASSSPPTPSMLELAPSPTASPVSSLPIPGYMPSPPGLPTSEPPVSSSVPMPAPNPIPLVPVPIASPQPHHAPKPAPVPTPLSIAPSVAPPSPPPLLTQPSYASSPAPMHSSNGIKGAYWPSWLGESLPPVRIPTSYFTHIFYAFVQLDATTYQLSVTRSDEQWMGNFTATLHIKNPSAKAFLSIGGGGSNTSTFSNMVGDPDKRAAFITSTIDVARKYGFDGLDLDWEFPTTPQDMSNLAILYSEWHLSLKKEAHFSGQVKLLLSSAVYFASSFFLGPVFRSYPAHAIKKYVDFVSPMCFDYHGSWDTSVTGAHALLFNKTSNVSTSFGISSWIEAGVPPEKIVMGLPQYGRTWKLKDPNKHGIGEPAVGTGPGNGLMLYTSIVDFNSQNNATEVYDEATVSTYSYSGTNWIGYDGLNSTETKVRFAKQHGLGGYFFWALGGDKNWTLSEAGKFCLFLQSSFNLKKD